jgi:hypothetical protein
MAVMKGKEGDEKESKGSERCGRKEKRGALKERDYMRGIPSREISHM